MRNRYTRVCPGCSLWYGWNQESERHWLCPDCSAKTGPARDAMLAEIEAMAAQVRRDLEKEIAGELFIRRSLPTANRQQEPSDL